MTFKGCLTFLAIVFAVIYGIAGQALVGNWAVGLLALTVIVIGVTIASLLMMTGRDKPIGGRTGGTRNDAEPKGIIKANGTQDSDLGAELWARDVADEIIREMASVSHKTEVHNGGEKPPYAKKGEW